MLQVTGYVRTLAPRRFRANSPELGCAAKVCRVYSGSDPRKVRSKKDEIIFVSGTESTSETVPEDAYDRRGLKRASIDSVGRQNNPPLWSRISSHLPTAHRSLPVLHPQQHKPRSFHFPRPPYKPPTAMPARSMLLAASLFAGASLVAAQAAPNWNYVSRPRSASDDG